MVPIFGLTLAIAGMAQLCSERSNSAPYRFAVRDGRRGRKMLLPKPSAILRRYRDALVPSGLERPEGGAMWCHGGPQ
jgi:hypothetical protein